MKQKNQVKIIGYNSAYNIDLLPKKKRDEIIEVPSDFAGLGYIDYQNTLWQFELAKELKSVGYNIDLNKLY